MKQVIYHIYRHLIQIPGGHQHLSTNPILYIVRINTKIN